MVNNLKKKHIISAIIITKNEKVIICDCLKSIDWVDEIIVVDSGSTDGTLDTVKKCRQSKIYESKIKGDFSAWRSLGAEKATSDWLFYIDADERCPPELANEIKSVVGFPNFQYPTLNISSTSSPVAFAIPRANIRLTKPLFHGGWWPDYVLRLMRKDALIGWEGKLHEQPKINGKTEKLKNHLIHLSHRGSLEHKFDTTIKYSITEAEQMFYTNHPPMTLPRFLSAMGREFWQRMFVSAGWKDGLEGIMEAIYQVFSVFISYARLWEMQNSKLANSNR